MKGYVFRRSDPAVFGAEIAIGKMKQKMSIMNPDGKKVGIIHQIQDKGKSIEELLGECKWLYQLMGLR